MTQVAKNCTKSRTASRTEFIHSPEEERGQTSREILCGVSVRLGLLGGFEGCEKIAALPVVGRCMRGVKVWPGRAEGGRLSGGLCLGLLWDVGCGQAREE